MFRAAVLRLNAVTGQKSTSVVFKQAPVAHRKASSIAGPFSPTLKAFSAVKPGSESEATTPGSGSTEQIANSEGAYDSSTPSPDSATNEIQGEKDVDFEQSSADRMPSDAATKSDHQSNSKPTNNQQSKPSKSTKVDK